MTEETRKQIKEAELDPDSNDVILNAGTLEQIIDDALQAERERLAGQVMELDYTYDDTFSNNALVERDEVLNLINPPSNKKIVVGMGNGDIIATIEEDNNGEITIHNLKKQHPSN